MNDSEMMLEETAVYLGETAATDSVANNQTVSNKDKNWGREGRDLCDQVSK